MVDSQLRRHNRLFGDGGRGQKWLIGDGDETLCGCWVDRKKWYLIEVDRELEELIQN